MVYYPLGDNRNPITAAYRANRGAYEGVGELPDPLVAAKTKLQQSVDIGKTFNPELASKLESIAAGEKPAGGPLASVLNSRAFKAILSPLQIVDTPRRAVVSGLREVMDVFDTDPNTTASFSDFTKQTKDVNYGFGTAFPMKGWLGRVVGFAGDVLLDPLTYATLGSTVAKKAVVKGALTAEGKQLTTRAALGGAKNVSNREGRKALADLTRSRLEAAVARGETGITRKYIDDLYHQVASVGKSALPKELALEMGIKGPGVYYFGSRVRVPLTGVFGKSLEYGITKTRLGVTNTRLGEFIQKYVTPTGTGSVRGMAPEDIRNLRADLSAGRIPADKASNVGHLLSAEDARRVGNARYLDDSETAVMNRVINHPDFESIRYRMGELIEKPDAAALASLSPGQREALDATKAWLASTVDEVESFKRLADPNFEMNRVVEYFPRMASDEAIKLHDEIGDAGFNKLIGDVDLTDAISQGSDVGATAGSFRSRGIVAGDVWFGHRLTAEDLTSRKLNFLARNAKNGNSIKFDFFDTDAQKILSKYVRQAAEEVGSANMHEYLVKNAPDLMRQLGKTMKPDGKFVQDVLVNTPKKTVNAAFKSLQDSVRIGQNGLNSVRNPGSDILAFRAKSRDLLDTLVAGELGPEDFDALVGTFNAAVSELDDATRRANGLLEEMNGLVENVQGKSNLALINERRLALKAEYDKILPEFKTLQKLHANKSASQKHLASAIKSLETYVDNSERFMRDLQALEAVHNTLPSVRTFKPIAGSRVAQAGKAYDEMYGSLPYTQERLVRQAALKELESAPILPNKYFELSRFYRTGDVKLLVGYSQDEKDMAFILRRWNQMENTPYVSIEREIAREKERLLLINEINSKAKQGRRVFRQSNVKESVAGPYVPRGITLDAFNKDVIKYNKRFPNAKPYQPAPREWQLPDALQRMRTQLSLDFQELAVLEQTFIKQDQVFLARVRNEYLDTVEKVSHFGIIPGDDFVDDLLRRNVDGLVQDSRAVVAQANAVLDASLVDNSITPAEIARQVAVRDAHEKRIEVLLDPKYGRTKPKAGELGPNEWVDDLDAMAEQSFRLAEEVRLAEKPLGPVIAVRDEAYALRQKQLRAENPVEARRYDEHISWAKTQVKRVGNILSDLRNQRVVEMRAYDKSARVAEVLRKKLTNIRKQTYSSSLFGKSLNDLRIELRLNGVSDLFWDELVDKHPGLMHHFDNISELTREAEFARLKVQTRPVRPGLDDYVTQQGFDDYVSQPSKPVGYYLSDDVAGGVDERLAADVLNRQRVAAAKANNERLAATVAENNQRVIASTSSDVLPESSITSSYFIGEREYNTLMSFLNNKVYVDDLQNGTWPVWRDGISYFDIYTAMVDVVFRELGRSADTIVNETTTLGGRFAHLETEIGRRTAEEMKYSKIASGELTFEEFLGADIVSPAGMGTQLPKGVDGIPAVREARLRLDDLENSDFYPIAKGAENRVNALYELSTIHGYAVDWTIPGTQPPMIGNRPIGFTEDSWAELMRGDTKNFGMGDDVGVIVDYAMTPEVLAVTYPELDSVLITSGNVTEGDALARFVQYISANQQVQVATDRVAVIREGLVGNWTKSYGAKLLDDVNKQKSIINREALLAQEADPQRLIDRGISLSEAAARSRLAQSRSAVEWTVAESDDLLRTTDNWVTAVDNLNAIVEGDTAKYVKSVDVGDLGKDVGKTVNELEDVAFVDDLGVLDVNPILEDTAVGRNSVSRRTSLQQDARNTPRLGVNAEQVGVQVKTLAEDIASVLDAPIGTKTVARLETEIQVLEKLLSPNRTRFDDEINALVALRGVRENLDLEERIDVLVRKKSEPVKRPASGPLFKFNLRKEIKLRREQIKFLSSSDAEFAAAKAVDGQPLAPAKPPVLGQGITEKKEVTSYRTDRVDEVAQREEVGVRNYDEGAIAENRFDDFGDLSSEAYADIETKATMRTDREIYLAGLSPKQRAIEEALDPILGPPKIPRKTQPSVTPLPRPTTIEQMVIPPISPEIAAARALSVEAQRTVTIQEKLVSLLDQDQELGRQVADIILADNADIVRVQIPDALDRVEAAKRVVTNLEAQFDAVSVAKNATEAQVEVVRNRLVEIRDLLDRVDKTAKTVPRLGVPLPQMRKVMVNGALEQGSPYALFHAEAQRVLADGVDLLDVLSGTTVSGPMRDVLLASVHANAEFVAAAAAMNAADLDAGILKNALMSMQKTGRLQADGRVVDAVTGEIIESGMTPANVIITRNLEEGWGALHNSYPGLQGSPELLELWENIVRINDPNQFGQVGKWVSEYTKFFKAYAVLTPGFHIRNALANSFVPFWAGAKFENMRTGLKYYVAWDKAKVTGVKWEDFLKTVPVEYRSALQIGRDSLFGSGGGIYSETFREQRGASRLYNNWLTNKSAKLGQISDNHARFVLGFDGGMQGMDTAMATARVRKFYFDYEDISQLDKDLKKIIPFWIFTKNNILTQAVNMWTSPQPYLKYESFKRNFRDAPPDNSDLNYVTRGGGWKLPFGGGEWYIAPDLGFNRVKAELTDMLQVGGLLEKTNPIIKTLGEQAIGKTTKGREFGSDVVVDNSGILGALQPILEKIGLGGTTAEGTSGINDRFLTALTQQLPTLNYAERLFPSKTQQMPDVRLNAALGFAGLPIKRQGGSGQVSSVTQLQTLIEELLKQKAG